MIRKPAQNEVFAVVKDAVATEQEFLRDALSLPVVDMSNESLKIYVEFIADRLLVKLDCPKVRIRLKKFQF
jgi:ribonucleotide reductase beta subunit family protein with ferritin-like domain